MFIVPRTTDNIKPAFFEFCGSASFSHGDYTASTFTGNVFYMPANYSYKAEYKEKNDVLVIHFESDLNSKMKNYQPRNPSVISMLFLRLYDIRNEKSDGYYYRALSLMCEILESISVQQISSSKNKTIEAFEDAVEYMENNYTSIDFSVAEMVEKAYMSNTYFRKLFQAKFGMTPVRYLIEKCLIYADKLLATGEYSIKEASEKSGFSDVKYFSRLVKKEYGVSPSELYRHIKNHNVSDATSRRIKALTEKD